MPGQPGDHARLPEETLPHLWFVDVTPQHLDGTQTIARLVTGKVDDRRTALTEDPQDRGAGQLGTERSARSTMPTERRPRWTRGVAARTSGARPVDAPARRPRTRSGRSSTASSTPARSTPIDQSRVDVDVADTKPTTERRPRAEAIRALQRGRCRRLLAAGTCGVASGSPVFDRGALGTATRCRWPHLEPTLETIVDPSA